MNPTASEPERGVCWALLGPTASGKTAVALALAEMCPLEIVSVDSMQVYRGMDIGSAKPTPGELAAVPHHMIDVLDPEEPCSAGWFSRRAHEAVADVRARGRRPLLVGGSPLYLKAILWGLVPRPSRDREARRRLQREAALRGGPALHERLARVDPDGAAAIHPNDVHRIVRALEVWETTGRAAGAPQDSFEGEPRLSAAMVGLSRPRQELYARIERRVDEMMSSGLLDEVRSLRGRLGPQARHALGYRELCEHLDGRIGLAEAVALIKRNTRRCAKHQMTWFRHFPGLRWLPVGPAEAPASVARKCLSAFGQRFAE